MLDLNEMRAAFAAHLAQDSTRLKNINDYEESERVTAKVSAMVTGRDTAIYRDYDGTRQSRERLQLRWGISRAKFYRIINEQKEAQAHA